MTGKFEAPDSSYMHVKRQLCFSYELIIVTKGTLYLCYQNRRYRISTGQYLLMPPSFDGNNWQYGYRPALADFYWLHFTTSYLPSLISIDHNSSLSLENTDYIVVPDQGTLQNPDKVVVLLRHLQDYVRNNYNLSDMGHDVKAIPRLSFTKPSIDYLTTAILCEIYSQECLQRLQAGPIRPEMELGKRVYFSILDYIKENPDKNIKAQDIAHIFGYNEKYLSRLFKKITGMTLKQYIIQQKIEDSNTYLIETEMPVYEIAAALGFSDAHNFQKLYKKTTGMTPTEYRNTFPKRIISHI